MTDQPDRPLPPEAGRFTKGTSGNPRGRPRKALPTASAFDIIMEKRLTLTRGGVAREVTLDEALQHKTYQDAITGHRAARREVLKMIAKRDAALAKKLEGEQSPSSPVKVIREYAPGNASEALLLLGVATLDARWTTAERQHLLLEPWATQLALGRRRGAARLTRQDVDHIRRDTRDPETLRWPRDTD